MSEINLTKKDVAVLVGLQDLGWETNTSKLREHVNTKRKDLEDLDLSNINYRVNTKFNIDDPDSDYNWVSTEQPDEDNIDDIENLPKGMLPKIIRSEDKKAISDALEQNKQKFVDDYEGMTSHVKSLDENTQKNANKIMELQEDIDKLEEENKKKEKKIEKMIQAIAIVSDGIGKSELQQIKRVADEEDNLTLKDLT